MSPFLPFGPWTPPSDNDAGDLMIIPGFASLGLRSTTAERDPKERGRERNATDDSDVKGLGLSLWEKGGEVVNARRSRTPIGSGRPSRSELYSTTPPPSFPPVLNPSDNNIKPTPFQSSDNVWGPVGSFNPFTTDCKLEEKDKELAAALEKMRLLELENQSLKARDVPTHHLHRGGVYPSSTTPPFQSHYPPPFTPAHIRPPPHQPYSEIASSVFMPGYGSSVLSSPGLEPNTFAGFGNGMSTPVQGNGHGHGHGQGYGFDTPSTQYRPTSERGYGNYGYPESLSLAEGVWRLEDDTLAREVVYSVLEHEGSDSGYSAPKHLIQAVLSGTFMYSEMATEYIKPMVWIIAHVQTRVPSENNNLKTAVTALATRMGLPKHVPDTTILNEAILEWAKPLCFTSSGNYLCQQLLEKGSTEEKRAFIEKIQEDIVAIASDKFGTHVLCKAIAHKDLEEKISGALITFGIFESMTTGARRLWREYLEKCRQVKSFDIFTRINDALKDRWSELACSNEHGTISVQQVFEVFGSQELMEPCYREILKDIPNIANNQYGHFLISKLIAYPNLHKPTCEAILCAYPPVATTHHGVNFVKIALMDGGRSSIMRYVDAICSQEEGRTPGIVAIATSSVGRGHLTFVLGSTTTTEQSRIRQTCRAFSTTLRNSQSGNDLLRTLGLINAVGNRRVPDRGGYYGGYGRFDLGSAISRIEDSRRTDDSDSTSRSSK